MKIKFIFLIPLIILLSGCVGVSSSGIFGTGVSVALDPRSVGTQIDDSIIGLIQSRKGFVHRSGGIQSALASTFQANEQVGCRWVLGDPFVPPKPRT